MIQCQSYECLLGVLHDLAWLRGKGHQDMVMLVGIFWQVILGSYKIWVCDACTYIRRLSPTSFGACDAWMYVSSCNMYCSIQPRCLEPVNSFCVCQLHALFWTFCLLVDVKPGQEPPKRIYVGFNSIIQCCWAPELRLQHWECIHTWW